MRTKAVIFLLVISCAGRVSLAQDADVQKSAWLMGVIFKLERLKETAIEDIRRYEAEIRKCDTTIRKSENIISLARQQGNAGAEGIAQEALTRAQEANARDRSGKTPLQVAESEGRKDVADLLRRHGGK